MKCLRSLRKLTARVAIAGFFVLIAMGLFPRHAAAWLSGPCTASGYASSQSLSPKDAKTQLTGTPGEFAINGGDTWTVHKGDYLSGVGNATPEQTAATVYVDAFGIPIPIIQSTGKGHGGSAGPYAVDTWSKFTREIGVEGSSDNCSGGFTIVVDNQNPATTVAGGTGLGLGVLGTLGVGGVAMRKR